MNQQKLVSVILAIVVVGLAVVTGLQLTKSNQVSKAPSVASSTGQVPSPVVQAPEPVSSTGTTPSKPVVSGYSMAEVTSHATPANCWTAINGQVYNLTTWIAQHPGGERAILSICGKDGSAAFNNQHGGQGRPEAALVQFKIGALAQ